MRSLPPITKNLIIINIIMFMATLVGQQYGLGNLDDLFGLHFFKAESFHLFQFVTYMFMHAGWMHLFFNMFALWMFGCTIENTFGPRRYLIYYFVTGIGAGLTQEIWQLVQFWIEFKGYTGNINLNGTLITMSEYLDTWTTIGASGAVYGILLAFGMTFPNERIMLLFPPIPMKAKYFVIAYAAIELFSVIGDNGGNIAHFAHLGGMLFGLLLILYWRHNNKNRNNFTGFNNWTPPSKRKSFKDRMRFFSDKVQSLFKKKQKRKTYTSNFKSRNIDYDYNAKKNGENASLEDILDKIKKSGYASLSEKEKRKLFEHSQKH